MLREVERVLQETKGAKKRWFTDDVIDLFVWQNGSGRVLSLQFCYDKRHKERSLTWSGESGYGHHGVDDGENKLGRIKASPILVPDGIFETEAVADLFASRAADMEPSLRAFVEKIIRAYPENAGLG